MAEPVLFTAEQRQIVSTMLGMDESEIFTDYHREPPLRDPATGFRSDKRRNEVWCSQCGAYFHFSDPHPHKGSGRKVDWPSDVDERA